MAEKISLAVSREKDGKLRIVYAGWDGAKRRVTAPLRYA
jgi:hypothetical protein